jgi:hypothetical protein
MPPTCVAAAQAARRGWWESWVALQPLVHHVVVILFAPQQTRKGLTLDGFEFGRHTRNGNSSIELIGSLDFTGKDLIKTRSQRQLKSNVVGQAQLNHPGFSGPQGYLIMGSGFRSSLPRINRLSPSQNKVVDPVLRIRSVVSASVKSLKVSFILDEEHGARTLAVPGHFPQVLMGRLNQHNIWVQRIFFHQGGLDYPARPRPRVAEPQGRQQVDLLSPSTPVRQAEAN